MVNPTLMDHLIRRHELEWNIWILSSRLWMKHMNIVLYTLNGTHEYCPVDIKLNIWIW